MYRLALRFTGTGFLWLNSFFIRVSSCGMIDTPREGDPPIRRIPCGALAYESTNQSLRGRKQFVSIHNQRIEVLIVPEKPACVRSGGQEIPLQMMLAED